MTTSSWWSQWISSKVDQILSLSVVDREATTKLCGEVWLASIAIIALLLSQRGNIYDSNRKHQHTRHYGNGNASYSVMATYMSLSSPLLQLTLLMITIWYIYHSAVAFDCYPRYNTTSQLRWISGIAAIVSWITLSLGYPSAQRYYHRIHHGHGHGHHSSGHHGHSNGNGNGMSHTLVSVILVTSLLVHASLARDDVAAHVTPWAMYIADMLLVGAITCIIIWLIDSRDHSLAEWAALVCIAGLQACIYSVGTWHQPHHTPLPWNAACLTFTFPA